MTGPIFLDDPILTTADAAFVSGAPVKHIETWIERIPALRDAPRHFTGRRVFSLLDAIRFAAMRGLTVGVPLGPTVAYQAGEFLHRHVLQHAAKHATTGRPLADAGMLAGPPAMALSVVDGEMCVGLIDPRQPKYTFARGTYAHPHVVVPIAPLVNAVLTRFLELVARGGRP